MIKKIVVSSPEETKQLAYRIGVKCTEGDVITLSGDLGAGKTTFTQGLAQGLEIKKTISSPTFTILKIYQGRLPLYHFDAYRLEHGDEDLGFEEMIGEEGVAVIEWPQFIAREIPHERLHIIIERLAENQRSITLESTSSRFDRLLGEEIC